MSLLHAHPMGSWSLSYPTVVTKPHLTRYRSILRRCSLVLMGPRPIGTGFYVDSDGFANLLMQFSIPDTGIQCGDTLATLTGETFDGRHVSGTDSIKTVGCGGHD